MPVVPRNYPGQWSRLHSLQRFGKVPLMLGHRRGETIAKRALLPLRQSELEKLA